MNKTILITGATDGIGLLTAQKLSSQGHKVLMHGRNPEKLKHAQSIVDNAETYLADLSVISDVSALAKAITAEHDQIDVLINNAGILKSPTPQAASGRDIRFEVNTIAPYVLTRELLPIIPRNGRVVNLSSAAQAPVDTNALLSYQPMGDMDAYAQSKLGITIWSAEMAKEFPDGPVVVSVNPGSLLASKMVKEGFGIAGNDINIGADILIRAALSDEFATATGKYFDNDSGRFAAPNSAAGNPDHVADVMRAIKMAAG